MAVDIFKNGSVELLVLLLLREQDAYGYQLAQLMEEKSDGLLTVKTASLYPILYRLVDTGYFSCKETHVDSSRDGTVRLSARVRIIYHLEAPGELRLQELMHEHKMFIQGFDAILSRTKGE